jgi:hypothetical protein
VVEMCGWLQVCESCKFKKSVIFVSVKCKVMFVANRVPENPCTEL